MLDTMTPPMDTPMNRRGRRLNKFFKALSDETRRSILELLEEREHTVGDIVGNFDLSQPTISRHLSVLKEAGLVIDQRHGQHVIYRLSEEHLARSVDQFFGRFRQCRGRAASVHPRLRPAPSLSA